MNRAWTLLGCTQASFLLDHQLRHAQPSYLQLLDVEFLIESAPIVTAPTAVAPTASAPRPMAPIATLPNATRAPNREHREKVMVTLLATRVCVRISIALPPPLRYLREA